MLSSNTSFYYLAVLSEAATRLSREVCMWLAQTTLGQSGGRRIPAPSSSSSGSTAPVCLPHLLLQLFAACNRSVPNEEIMLSSVAIMLNMAMHRELAGRVDVWWMAPRRDLSTTSQRSQPPPPRGGGGSECPARHLTSTAAASSCGPDGGGTVYRGVPLWHAASAV